MHGARTLHMGEVQVAQNGSVTKDLVQDPWQGGLSLLLRDGPYSERMVRLVPQRKNMSSNERSTAGFSLLIKSPRQLYLIERRVRLVMHDTILMCSRGG